MFSLKKFWFPFFVIPILVSVSLIFAADETLTITTYYPSPYGSYNILNLPGQPIISGQIGGAMTNPAGPQILAFDDFWVSRGITYNSGTRRFTVPVAGVYRITINPFFNTGVGSGRVLVGVNTDAPTLLTHRGECYREAALYDTGCIDSVVQLNANDYIVFYLYAGTLYNQPASDRFTQFSIVKIA